MGLSILKFCKCKLDNAQFGACLRPKFEINYNLGIMLFLNVLVELKNRLMD